MIPIVKHKLKVLNHKSLHILKAKEIYNTAT